MLTLDLLRYKVTGDTVTPIYLTVTGGRKYLDAAERVIGIYKSNSGKTLGELEEELEDTLGSAPDYKVYRGLAKMMEGYVETAPAVDIDAEELRARVFSMAAARRPDSARARPRVDEHGFAETRRDCRRDRGQRGRYRPRAVLRP